MSFLQSAMVHHGAGVVFAVTLFARLGAPIPAAPLLVVAGALGARDQRELALAVAAAAIASLAGDGAWFLAGKRYGCRVLKVMCRISLSPETCVRQSSDLLGKWGGVSLLAAKFVPGLSAVAAPMAGALGMPVRRFLAFQSVSSVVWALVFVYLGSAFSKDVAVLLGAISAIGINALGLVVLVVVFYAALSFMRRRLAARDGSIPRISSTELAEMFLSREMPLLVDVRSAFVGQANDARIPGAVAVHMAALKRWAHGLSRDREIVLYCDCPNEATAAKASRLLLREGFSNVSVLKGGIDAWRLGALGEGHAERDGKHSGSESAHEPLSRVIPRDGSVLGHLGQVNGVGNPYRHSMNSDRIPRPPLRAPVLTLFLLAMGAATCGMALSNDPLGNAAFLAENKAAMDKMMVGMHAASTGDVDRDFAASMSAHHQGAIDMARAELRHGSNEQLRRIAQEIIVEQQQEIEAMQRAVRSSKNP